MYLQLFSEIDTSACHCPLHDFSHEVSDNMVFSELETFVKIVKHDTRMYNQCQLNIRHVIQPHVNNHSIGT